MYSRVSGETAAGDLRYFTEESLDGVLINIEGQVANEEGIARGGDGVTVLLGAVGSTIAGIGVSGLGVGVVEVEGAAIELMALHGLVGLGGRLRVVEVDVAEALAAAGVLIVDDASADEASEIFESGSEGVIIHAPAQGASEEGSGSVVGLGLLGLLSDLLLSLSLLGRGSLGLLLGLRLGRVRVIGFRVRVGGFLGMWLEMSS